MGSARALHLLSLPVGIVSDSTRKNAPGGSCGEHVSARRGARRGRRGCSGPARGAWRARCTPAGPYLSIIPRGGDELPGGRGADGPATPLPPTRPPQAMARSAYMLPRRRPSHNSTVDTPLRGSSGSPSPAPPSQSMILKCQSERSPSAGRGGCGRSGGRRGAAGGCSQSPRCRRAGATIHLGRHPPEVHPACGGCPLLQRAAVRSHRRHQREVGS